MKTSLISGLLGASIVLFGSPAFAQDAPAPKKQQRVVVKNKSKADSELLKKAAELSAKASDLASKGDTTLAAKYAAEASALLKKAQKSERNVQRDVRRDVARIDREMAQREREVRVRVERNDEAANSWVEEIANAQSAEAHEHAVRAYEKAMKLHGHEQDLHEQTSDLHKRYLKLNAENGVLQGMFDDNGEVADHLLRIAPLMERLENDQIQLQLRTRLEDLSELENLNVDLTDLAEAWSVQVGDLAAIDTLGALAPHMKHAQLDLLGADLEGIDLAAMGIDLSAIEGGDVQAFAFAMPGGETKNGVWAMAPHDGQEKAVQRYIFRANPGHECDCEGECEEGCVAEAIQGHVMGLYSTDAPHDGHASGNVFFPGEYTDLARNVQVYVMPEGQEGMNWTSRENGNFAWTTEVPGENHVFEWTTDANPFMHQNDVEVHGEHEVRVIRSGEGGQVIIHGGDGEQNIYIHGQVGHECVEDHEVHMHDRGEEMIHFGHALPQAPRAPQAPHAPRALQDPRAPQAPRAMLRLPNSQPSPRIRLHDHEGQEIRGRVIIDGETIEYTTDGESDVLLAPRDASAPAPVRVKNKKMEAEQLIQEMRAEMEALRQELSDLRRQMKDDPLVRAQHDTRLEDLRVWRASMTPVADRKRAGLGSR